MKHFFTKASWVLLSPLVNITKEGDIYRTAYRGRVWYIPYPKRWMALWAKDFMKTHVRYEDVLGPGDVVVEVGACTGEYTVAAAEIVGASGHVHTFEVDPIVIQCLKKNISAAGFDKMITATHAGVSDQAQTIEPGTRPQHHCQLDVSRRQKPDHDLSSGHRYPGRIFLRPSGP